MQQGVRRAAGAQGSIQPLQCVPGNGLVELRLFTAAQQQYPRRAADTGQHQCLSGFALEVPQFERRGEGAIAGAVQGLCCR